MIIDFDGNVLDKTYFKLAPYILNLKLNINREKGFIIFDDITYELTTTVISWQQYRIEPNGKFTNLTSGNFELNSFDDYQWLRMRTVEPMMSTVNEGYAYVYVLTSPKIDGYGLANDLLFVAVLINYNKSESATVLLYHSQSQFVSEFTTSLFCNIEYVGVGQYCTLLNLAYNSLNYSTLRVNFLSSGSVVLFNSSIISGTQDLNTINTLVDLMGLPYGGFLEIIPKPLEDGGLIIYFNIFSENSTIDRKYSQTFSQSYNNILAIWNYFLILPNNTLLLPDSSSDNNTWSLKAIDVPKYIDRDKGYFNTNINSTFPKINDYLKFSDIKNISINFYVPVILSNGKLSIYYQLNDQRNILRQSTSCISTTAKCTLANNDTMVIVTVLDSVLSKSGGNYFIKVDNNFVKDRVHEEPLLGIKENIWKFTIEDSKSPYYIISSISGLLRLNLEGTDEIARYTNDNRTKFFNGLLDELADVILIPRDRLSKDSKEQTDPDSKLLLFSIKISEVKDHDEKDANTTMYDLNNMMANSDQTFIVQGDHTKYLDSTFGFKPKPNYWEEYKFKLLGALLAIIILVILYFLARLRSKNKRKEGRNFAIFQFALIIFDFVMDILFITNNANDFPKLYTPSLIFFTLPIASNTILAFLLITKENAKSKFSEWFEKNTKLASAFTILAGADIEILSLLHSNLAGFEVFNAPLSESAKHKIFWGSLLNIFIEDVPQLIIQILYRNYSIKYDIIPILNLISSAINLTVNIVGRLYQAIRNIQNRNKLNTNVSDDNL
ncbi:hypothetical protein RclHR1_01410028 [Rhizophagus clarus]|uniref:Uncharacterized protein n=1 Tax=Rhizophagus clarus TaxID=94130 RepID=A0A2Z6QDL0_9GLOM|nr:hypothetical protein RclHR1_01410028 [Rhizophagus clarus]GES75115.1 hypothetical protein GLOIN_2v1842544 [Rhizophagus clarus]